MNNQWETPYCGTLKISNPKTLEKWIQNGEYNKELNSGYIFNPDCGRFRSEKCTCCKCRKPNGTQIGNKLREILFKYKLSAQR